MIFYREGLNFVIMRYLVAFVVLGVFAIIVKNDIINLYAYLKRRFLKK